MSGEKRKGPSWITGPAVGEGGAVGDGEVGTTIGGKLDGVTPVGAAESWQAPKTSRAAMVRRAVAVCRFKEILRPWGLYLP
jgi:hypothetical protein